MFLLLITFYVLLFNYFGKFAHSEFAFLGRQPTAINPTLYDPRIDLIIQLDDMTFNDTVFCKHSLSSDNDNDCAAYVVEASFYSIKFLLNLRRKLDRDKNFNNHIVITSLINFIRVFRCNFIKQIFEFFTIQ